MNMTYFHIVIYPLLFSDDINVGRGAGSIIMGWHNDKYTKTITHTHTHLKAVNKNTYVNSRSMIQTII